MLGGEQLNISSKDVTLEGASDATIIDAEGLSRGIAVADGGRLTVRRVAHACPESALQVERQAALWHRMGLCAGWT